MLWHDSCATNWLKIEWEGVVHFQFDYSREVLLKNNISWIPDADMIDFLETIFKEF